MKEWMKPQIAIDYFRSNEYVAACTKPLNPIAINDSELYAIDFVYDNGYDYTAVHDGNTSQHVYDSIENILGGEINKTMKNYTGLYTNKTLYRKIDHLSGHTDYNNDNYFERIGTYTVWVTDRAIHFWLYDGSVTPGDDFDPTTGTNQS